MTELVKLEFEDQPKNEGIRKDAVDHDAMMAVMSAMRMHSSVLKVQEDGLGLLGALMYEDPINHKKAVRLGAIEIIVCAMNNHTEADLRYNGLVALEDLRHNGLVALDNVFGEYKLAFAKFDEADGIDAVLPAADDHGVLSAEDTGEGRVSFSVKVWHVLGRLVKHADKDFRKKMIKKKGAIRKIAPWIESEVECLELAATEATTDLTAAMRAMKDEATQPR